jgi:hypothetical protein
MAESERARVHGCLDAPIAVDVVRAFGEGYALSQPEWMPLLLNELDRTVGRQLHVRIADMFLQQPNSAVRAASHLLECGRELEGADESTRFDTDVSILRRRSDRAG